MSYTERRAEKKKGDRACNKGEIGGGVLEMMSAQGSHCDRDSCDGGDKVATNQDRVGKMSRRKGRHRDMRDCIIML